MKEESVWSLKQKYARKITIYYALVCCFFLGFINALIIAQAKD